MKKDIKYIVALCMAFCLYFIAKKAIFPDIYYAIQGLINIYPLSFFLAYCIVGIPVFLFVLFSNHYQIFEALGLRGNILRAIAVIFVFSLPMFLGYGIMADFQVSLDAKDFWFLVIFAAFFEELYYRGFFFGQLFKKNQIGFYSSPFY